MSTNMVYYSIEADIPLSLSEKLMDFVLRRYLQLHREEIVNVSRDAVDGYPSLILTVSSNGERALLIQLRGSRPLRLGIMMLDQGVPQERADLVRQDISIIINFFEERIRRSTLYFAWREGEEIVPEKTGGGGDSPFNRLFLETQVLLFIGFVVLSIFIIQVVGVLTPIFILLAQLVVVMYSNKFVARIGDWRITERNPSIHFMEYQLPLEEGERLRQSLVGERLMELKREVYERTIRLNGQIDCDTAHQVFSRFGLECRPENMGSREINVYGLVKRAADKFGFPMPEVVVSNSTRPNAAASGPWPSRGVVLITTGLLVQLNEDEILSVLGHEFGHLKGHDPLFLYGLTAAQYLLLYYFGFQFISSSLLFFFAYFWLSSVILYFIAKFFEYKADLISIMIVGQPRVFAAALEKIGFRMLLLERMPLFRIQEWLSLDPHPPTYFRIGQLEKIRDSVRISHPLLQAVRDVTHGFLSSF
ncbi:MAG: heat shock protein HtpX [Thermoproteota archaeon]|nr:heat shock protein HtpX [Thermoproteota archaeon]